MKMIDEQRKKFDDIFDDAFLAIYPTFINDVNALLAPEKRVVTPAKNVLTTELRVLAFTRLGVDDTAQVARFLGVTLNTVYTYRKIDCKKGIIENVVKLLSLLINHLSALDDIEQIVDLTGGKLATGDAVKLFKPLHIA